MVIAGGAVDDQRAGRGEHDWRLVDAEGAQSRDGEGITIDIANLVRLQVERVKAVVGGGEETAGRVEAIGRGAAGARLPLIDRDELRDGGKPVGPVHANVAGGDA